MWLSRTLTRRLLDSIRSTSLGKLDSRNLRMSTEAPVESIVNEEPKDDENPLKRISDSIHSPIELPTKKPKLKKKKVAMLISYCGQGYHGMQINHGFKTIEGDLFDAFLKLGIMDEEAHKTPNLVLFQRAARTDKGVSAVKQVISLKMDLSEDDMVKKICENLPSCIRVFAIKKTTAGFNSKVACDSRTYAYIMPTFAFSSSETVISKKYRLPEEKFAELNEVLGLYKGTRNYHNFTSRRIPRDPSCQRYITDFYSSKPYLVDDMEFVKLTIKGQSFMLNQIRKMIGLAISVMRGLVTKENFETAFSLERIDIPIAPGLNLLLEEPHYKSYNRRFGSDGIHEALDWSPYESEIEKFCEEHVYPVIYNGETTAEGGSMAKWLPALSLHTFGPREEGANNESCDSDVPCAS